jgi:hypothetical protein
MFFVAFADTNTPTQQKGQQPTYKGVDYTLVLTYLLSCTYNKLPTLRGISISFAAIPCERRRVLRFPSPAERINVAPEMSTQAAKNWPHGTVV